MGVKDFFKIKVVNKKSEFNGKTIGELGEVVKLNNLSQVLGIEGNACVCVDASHSIYSSILALERVASLSDEDGNTTVHINTIFNKIVQLAASGLKQIWIFDSPEPNEMKKAELAKRQEKRVQAVEKGYVNQEKIAYKLNSKHVEDIKTLLKGMGIMTIQAPAGIEAEQYGAFLTKGPASDRFCHYMVSGDSDVLIFGGNLLRIMSEKSSTGKSSKTVYRIYELSRILEALDLTYDQFLQMCVVMGTDFNEKTPGIGPAKVVSEIRKDEVFISSDQEKAMKYFKSLTMEDAGIESATIVQEKYNKKTIMDFLEAKKFKKERVEKILEKYKPVGVETQ